LNFDLENKFTDDHMIKLVVEDSQEKLAIFVTESWHNCNNSSENRLIDSLTVLKMVMDAEGNLSSKQVTITLPE
jgi:negative regulator of genetic competence, sporulation and motility